MQGYILRVGKSRSVKIRRTTPPDFREEAVGAANPAETIPFFGVNRGFRRDAVDAGFTFSGMTFLTDAPLALPVRPSLKWTGSSTGTQTGANNLLNEQDHPDCLWVMYEIIFKWNIRFQTERSWPASRSLLWKGVRN